MNVLGTASTQWASRPADERFWTVDDLHAACTTFRNEARTATLPIDSLRVEAIDGDIRLLGRTGVPARLTNYSFGQLCRLSGGEVKPPPSYLATLPATLAAQNLNHGFKAKAEIDAEYKVRMLMRVNGAIELRAALSETYERLWNNDVTRRLQDLQGRGWTVPPAMPAPVDGVGTRTATAADCGEYTLVRPGQQISPSGLYASDRDMFAFMIHPDRIVDAGSGRKLFRGFFCWNSEVGDKSFGIQTFLFDYVCFNHNVWGADKVMEVRMRHVGESLQYKSGRAFEVELRKYADRSAAEDEQNIQRARRFMLGGTKDEVLDKLFGMKSIGLSRRTLDAAYTVAEQQPAYGDPKSAWGMAQGITEVSQTEKWTDARVAMDRAAGRVMEMAF